MRAAQEEAFKDQVAYLVKIEKLGLDELLLMLQEGAEKQGYKGWRKHIPGTSSNPAILEMERHEKIIKAIPPALRYDLGRFKGMEVGMTQNARAKAWIACRQCIWRKPRMLCVG